MPPKTRRALEYRALYATVNRLAETIGRFVFDATGNPNIVKAHDAFREGLLYDKKEKQLTALADLERALTVVDVSTLEEVDYPIKFQHYGPLDVYQTFAAVNPDSSDYEVAQAYAFVNKVMPRVVRTGEQVEKYLQTGVYVLPADVRDTLENIYAQGKDYFADLSPKPAAVPAAPPVKKFAHQPDTTRGAAVMALHGKRPTAAAKLVEGVDVYVRSIVPIYLRLVAGDTEQARELAKTVAVQRPIKIDTDMVPWANVADILAADVATSTADQRVTRALRDALEVVGAIQRRGAATNTHKNVIQDSINTTLHAIHRLLSAKTDEPQVIGMFTRLLSPAVSKITQTTGLTGITLAPPSKGFTAEQQPRVVYATEGAEVEVRTIDAFEAVRAVSDLLFGPFNRQARTRRIDSGLINCLFAANPKAVDADIRAELDKRMQDIPDCTSNQEIVAVYNAINALEVEIDEKLEPVLAVFAEKQLYFELSRIPNLAGVGSKVAEQLYLYSVVRTPPDQWPKAQARDTDATPSTAIELISQNIGTGDYKTFRETAVRAYRAGTAAYDELTGFDRNSREALEAAFAQNTLKNVTALLNFTARLREGLLEARNPVKRRISQTLFRAIQITQQRLESAGIGTPYTRENSAKSSPHLRFQVV
jgi:hypothetical protein